MRNELALLHLPFIVLVGELASWRGRAATPNSAATAATAPRLHTHSHSHCRTNIPFQLSQLIIRAITNTFHRQFVDFIVCMRVPPPSCTSRGGGGEERGYVGIRDGS